MDRLPRWAGFWILAALVALVAGWVWVDAGAADTHLLRAGPTGDWIRMERPFYLGIHWDAPVTALFRRDFVLPEAGRSPALEVAAREECIGFLDRKVFFEEPHDPKRWNQVRTLTLPPGTASGRHELIFLVKASRTEPMLRVEAPELGLSTDGDWDFSLDAVHWERAILARAAQPPSLDPAPPTAPRALLGVSGWLGLAFGAGAALGLWGRNRLRASTARWLLLGLWVALAVNNIASIPSGLGMDIQGHLEYVKFMARFHRIPLATEGWQSFQPPLTYLLATPLYLLKPGLADGTALKVLRLIPLACGLLQVEVAYRAVRAVYPGRNGLQIAGTVLGGLLPISVYGSQTFGNEPLAGLLCSLAILWVVSRPPVRGLGAGFAVGLGGLLGLALLAKVTALLVIPLLVGFVLLRAARGGPETLRFLGLLGLALALVAGWYFARNLVHLGHPFLGGWDRARGIRYWQEPGYVTASSLAAFGTALVRPLYAGASGIWNGLYATFWLDGNLSGQCPPRMVFPPWNSGFLLAGALTALAPLGAMAAGAATGWRRPAVALCLACIGVLTFSILALHLTAAPGYASIKGTYLLGLLPCFAILGTAGLEVLARRPWTRALAAGLLAAWALSVYAAYFVVRPVTPAPRASGASGTAVTGPASSPCRPAARTPPGLS